MSVLVLWANPLVRGLGGVAVGAAAGECANLIYRNCNDAEKLRWQKKRVMHHGELGIYAIASSLKARSPFMTGIGIGLAVSDISDKDEWFRQWPDRVAKAFKRIV